MIRTTKTNDYHHHITHHINPGSRNMTEDSTILIDDNILQGVKNECDGIICDNLFNEEYDENYTGTVRDGVNDEDEEERDLTNLTWLIELRNQTMGFVNMTLDDETKKDNESIAVPIEVLNSGQQRSQHCQEPENEMSIKPSTDILGQPNPGMTLQIPQHKSEETRAVKVTHQLKRPSPSERYEMFLHKIKRELETYEDLAINYQSDIVHKPPFNYSHIIGMAILENGRPVTLQQICSWIERKFAFFRVRKKWNNSIRHNLSLHPCFRKIGRNKEDKGKGGYWELGVDPKKCDRKRIRNRKSSTQPAKAQKKHYVKTKKRRPQNLAIIKKLNIKHYNGNLKKYPCEQEYEELLLDDMDVQQNIDVMSSNTNTNNLNNINTNDICCKHSESRTGLQQLHHQPNIKIAARNVKQKETDEAMLTSYINDEDDDDNDTTNLQQNADFNAFNEKCPLDDSICHINEQSLDQSCQHDLQQQYKLGTIIISSTSAAGTDMPILQNINPRTLNSFRTTNPKKQLLAEQQQSHKSIIRYSELENLQQSENVIISTYISNLSDDFTPCTHESTKSNQCHNFASTSSSNSVTVDFSAFPAHTAQTKPNVIVEQLIQPSLNFSALEIPTDCMPASSALNNSTSTTMSMIGSQNGGDTNSVVNENFRPYIDGIDEAFQYLRSIDNTRNEDILDNLLDITVSDY